MNNKELISKVDVIEQIISINAKDIQKANKGLDPILSYLWSKDGG